MGVASVYFAWRSNDIALRQSKSNVVVLNEWNVGYDFDAEEPVVLLGCVERIRFSNLGNASDSIVGYDTTVYYKNTQSVFKSTAGMSANSYSLLSPSSTRVSYEASEELQSAMDRLILKVAPGFAFGDQRSSITGNVEAVTFPYDVDGLDTFDLEMSIVYGVSPGNAFNLFFEPKKPLFSSQPTNLAPLDFEINFKLASGSVAKTPRINCGAIDIEQPAPNPPTPLALANSSLSSIALNPASPSEMKFSQQINVSLSYKTDEAAGVRIWALPHFANQTVPREFIINPSPIYPVGTGNASAFVSVTSGEAIVDEIVLQMWNADKSVLLYETRLPVNYHFGN